MAAPPPGVSTAITTRRRDAVENPRELSPEIHLQGLTVSIGETIGRDGLAKIAETFWPADKAQDELLPLVLFRGNWTFGRAQGWFNYAQVCRAAGLTLRDAKTLGQNNPEVLHAAGLHFASPDYTTQDGVAHIENKIRNGLEALTRRMLGTEKPVDPDLLDYMTELIPCPFGRWPALEPISRYSPWSSRPWRQTPRIRTPSEPIPASWPFILDAEKAQGRDGANLLLAIDAVVPRSIPKQIREDVCQDLVLAVLTGEIEADSLVDTYREHVKRVFRQFPTKYGPLSLDAPPPWDRDGRTLAETLVA